MEGLQSLVDGKPGEIDPRRAVGSTSSVLNDKRGGGTYEVFSPIRTDDEILAQDVYESSVHCWSDVVELGDERVFEPIDETFTQEDDDGWAEDRLEESERRKGGEGEGERYGEEREEGGGRGRGQLNEVAKGDDEEHQGELESLDDI